MPKVDLDFIEELPRVEEVGTVIACFQCSACVADCPEPWNFKGTDIDAWLKVAGRNLALAKGESPDKLALSKHKIKTDPILKAVGK